MRRRKWVISIIGAWGLAGLLVSASGCNFSQLIMDSLTSNLTGSSSVSGTAVTTFSSPTSTLGDSLTSGTGSNVSGGVLPSAQPSPTLQELMNGPFIGP